jgi:hypothetical protein
MMTKVARNAGPPKQRRVRVVIRRQPGQGPRGGAARRLPWLTTPRARSMLDSGNAPAAAAAWTGGAPVAGVNGDGQLRGGVRNTPPTLLASAVTAFTLVRRL